MEDLSAQSSRLGRRLGRRRIQGELNGLSEAILGSAISVHRKLGPGLLESVYETCLAYELETRCIDFHRQVPMQVRYGGLTIDDGYRVDILVAGQVVVEVKAVKAVLPVHRAQLLTYLRLSECPLGLLLNFNVPVLKDGITRLANRFPDLHPSATAT